MSPLRQSQQCWTYALVNRLVWEGASSSESEY